MGFPVHVASWTTVQCLPPPSTCIHILRHLRAMSVPQLHTWEAFSIPASSGADAEIPSLLNTLTSCC